MERGTSGVGGNGRGVERSGETNENLKFQLSPNKVEISWNMGSFGKKGEEGESSFYVRRGQHVPFVLSSNGSPRHAKVPNRTENETSTNQRFVSTTEVL